MEGVDTKLADLLDKFGKEVLGFLSEEDLQDFQLECFRGGLHRTHRLTSKITRDDSEEALQKSQHSFQQLFEADDSFSFLSTRSDFLLGRSAVSLPAQEPSPDFSKSHPDKKEAKGPIKPSFKLKKEPKSVSVLGSRMGTVEAVARSLDSQIKHFQTIATTHFDCFPTVATRISEVAREFLKTIAGLPTAHLEIPKLKVAIQKATLTISFVEKLEAMAQKPHNFFVRFVTGSPKHPDAPLNWQVFSQKASRVLSPPLITWFACDELTKIHTGLGLSLSAIARNPENFINKIEKIAAFAQLLSLENGTGEAVFPGVSLSQILRASAFYSGFAHQISKNPKLQKDYVEFPVRKNLFLSAHGALLAHIEVDFQAKTIEGQHPLD